MTDQGNENDCCGSVHNTPFCPYCGKVLQRPTHDLRSLLRFIRKQQRLNTLAVDRIKKEGSNMRDEKRRKSCSQLAEQYAAWDLQLTEVLRKTAEVQQ